MGDLWSIPCQPQRAGRRSTADAVGVARGVEERDIQSPPGMPGAIGWSQMVKLVRKWINHGLW